MGMGTAPTVLPGTKVKIFNRITKKVFTRPATSGTRHRVDEGSYVLAFKDSGSPDGESLAIWNKAKDQWEAPFDDDEEG